MPEVGFSVFIYNSINNEMRIVLRIEGAGFQIDRFRQKNFVPRCEGAIYFTILKPIFCPDRDQDVSIDTYEIIFGPT